MELAEIGKTIRAARQAHGLTQVRLARIAGISRGTLNGLETGMVKELGFQKLDTILNILGYELAPAAASPPGRSTRPWDPAARELLRRMARRYIWWQTPEASVKDPHRVIAQVMDLGTLEDFQEAAAILGKRRMAGVLNLAPPGWFHPKSWAFWNIALGRTTSGRIPPIPARRRDALPDPA
ncbi:MAG: helix-turn-helix domain-containing protein [Deltaproteobacteria bacterium]|uniref:helix-turn-helix domain-containing protein n=1 Tax=Candidatus Deferrimicrobium sp. TaxID=3060586 RepID=UPI002716D7F1|nr:helix-turn-helix domain-containing protein [Candidatus Deferrimicrobium sp.]MCR4309218.1 helix-turn-helix domain-containing protein [Deltaproteobacteria bacterium]MDO8737491.1 helix-turn-helix domain-containing protein [Candidatus Deferrimicrobium sp.]